MAYTFQRAYLTLEFSILGAAFASNIRVFVVVAVVPWEAHCSLCLKAFSKLMGALNMGKYL